MSQSGLSGKIWSEGHTKNGFAAKIWIILVILFAHTCNIIDGCAALCAMVKWGNEEASGVLQQENCIE